jgi:hypothetical protein
MDKLIMYWALKAALIEKLLEEEVPFEDSFIENQVTGYVYGGIRDETISDHLLQIVGILKTL